MQRLIKSPFALHNGELIHISRADKGSDYLCPGCLSRMVPKTAAQRRQAHFSHYAALNCNQESVLHKTAKQLLKANINHQQKPVIVWDCCICNKLHTKNFFVSTANSLIEQYLDSCKPDIISTTESGEATAIIEIVVTHEPEPRVYETAKALCLPVIEFHPRNSEDLEQLTQKELRASQVSVCLTPKCPNCESPLETRKIVLWEFQCWQCHSGTPFAWAEWEHGSQHSPAHFSAEEIQAANQAGAKIDFRFSREAQGSYNANICHFCNVLQGDWYLHDHLIGLEDQVSEIQKLIDHLKSLGIGPDNLPFLPRTVHASLACLQCGLSNPRAERPES
jgi:hypothetical protein